MASIAAASFTMRFKAVSVVYPGMQTALLANAARTHCYARISTQKWLPASPARFLLTFPPVADVLPASVGACWQQGEALFTHPRPLRLAVRTPPFHGGNTGSIPVGVAISSLRGCFISISLKSLVYQLPIWYSKGGLNEGAYGHSNRQGNG